ncbi:hypothetical protein PFISCL1PPCAC_6055, partial [Pristionchus fissidentatus]
YLSSQISISPSLVLSRHPNTMDREEKEEKREEGEKGEDEREETTQTGEPEAKRGKMTVEEVDEVAESASQFISYDPATMKIDGESLPEILGLRGNPTAVLLQIHRISVDPPQRFVQIPHPIEKSIKKAMQDSYWKLLSEDLEKSPPVYKTAISLVNEIKEMLLNGLITMRDEKKRGEVNARLDINTLQNQVEQNALDVPSIASFILDTFLSLCAPHRDPEINEIRSKMDNIPDLLRGLMEMTDKMKEDAVSFRLEMRREEVIKAAREYELHDLKESFNVVAGAKDKLENWIKKVYEKSKEETDSIERIDEIVRRIAVKGFIENLSYSSISDIPFHWRLDFKEIEKFSIIRMKLIIISCSLYVLNNIHSLSSENMQTLKDRLIKLCEELRKDNLEDILSSIHVECQNVLREEGRLDEETEMKLGVIRQFDKKDQPLMGVAGTRMDNYLSTLLQSPSSSLSSPPSLFTPIADLFPPLKSKFGRYIDHNENTFRDIYDSVLSSIVSPQSEDLVQV